jgi:thioredoxin 2
MAENRHLVCPGCGQVNRVATEQLGKAPRCGACKQPLLPGHPVQLDDATFDRFIERSHIPVVVDFWAEWCGPCKMMAPAYEQAATRLEPDAILAKLDTERAPRVAARFGIRSIPTLVFFKQGREVARQAGAMSLPQIEQWVRSRVD